MGRLVLWDIDHTLISAGEIDHLAYRDVFYELTGMPIQELPPRGTGWTVPVTLRHLLLQNGVRNNRIDELTERAVELLPDRFAEHREQMTKDGVLLPGARDALDAIRALPSTVSTVLTGNLRAVALCKLDTFGLSRLLDIEVGAFGSDSRERPHLVRLAQRRAGRRYGYEYTRSNTVLVGDSLEDVTAGHNGGASVIGVASGHATIDALRDAGADAVLPDLVDAAAVKRAVLTMTATGR